MYFEYDELQLDRVLRMLRLELQFRESTPRLQYMQICLTLPYRVREATGFNDIAWEKEAFSPADFEQSDA